MNGYSHYKTAAVAACLVVFMTAFARPASADIFMRVDEQGTICLTNLPGSPDYRLLIKERRPRSNALPGTYDVIIKEAAEAYRVEAPLLKAMVKVESDFDPRAVSAKGARGLMQLMPQNFDMLGVKNPFDPRENIMAGTRYLKGLLDRYEGDIDLALAAYNAGPDAVDRFGRIPPIEETQKYVQRVLEYYHLLK
ncbi:MAG: lytic transglycosylase domain-containing protein [Deltaproteobacteria bacterium]|nr:lytic transglycosylase domain-containing protein [Deltaproteobacteria bacterium]